MDEDALSPRPPAALRMLVSWQAGRLATIAARINSQQLDSPSRSDFAVLACLSEYGDLSQADLGRTLGIDRNNINGICSRLQQQGHIQRRIDPHDRRRNIVTITASGTTRFVALETTAQAVQAELLTSLTAHETNTLSALLDKALGGHPSQPA